MPEEHELTGAGSANTSAPDHLPQGSPGREGPASPHPDATMVEIVIDRDLAVQNVGSDAGKARRMRPHGAMTKGSTAEELDDVRAVMRPFLDDEIRRVHEEKSHRPKSHVARATPAQADSLKAFCLRFAASLERNLANHPGDDNRHRSQQRLGQARRVIAQVKAALGIPHDGRTLEQCRREAVEKARVLDTALTSLKARSDAGTDPSVTPWLETSGGRETLPGGRRTALDGRRPGSAWSEEMPGIGGAIAAVPRPPDHPRGADVRSGR